VREGSDSMTSCALAIQRSVLAEIPIRTLARQATVSVKGPFGNVPVSQLRGQDRCIVLPFS
jgi:hypothetical protein